MIPCVIYAAKSTEDKHASIPGQIKVCQDRVEREGWEVVGVDHDEGFSAYSGNRGPGLERAKRLAAEAAEKRGKCVLIAEDNDRFARGAGDAPGAADHLVEVFFAMRRQGVELWSDRIGKLDAVTAVVEGERAHHESERKVQGTRRGVRQRKERGLPVGQVLTGYRLVRTIVDDVVVKTTRVEDEVYSPVVERIFRMYDEGYTPREIAEIFNVEDLRGRRGQPFTGQRVRELLRNSGFLGLHGYPRISWMDDALWERVERRMNERTEYYHQLGGRKPKKEYLLQGICTCGYCGARLHIRRGKYLCANRNMRTGLCTAATAIKPDVLESAIVARLGKFTGDLKVWVREQVKESEERREGLQKSVDSAQVQLAQLDRRIEGIQRLLDQALDGHDDAGAATALRELARLDEDRAEQAQAVARATAKLQEWIVEPDLEAMSRWLRDVAAQVEGRLAKAEGMDAVRAAIRSVVDYISVREVEENDGRRLLLIDVFLDGDRLPSMILGGDPDERTPLNAMGALLNSERS